MQDFKKKLKTGIRKLGGAGAFTGILLCILLFLSQGVVRLVKEDAGLLLEGNKSIAGIQGEKDHTIDLLVVGDSESYTSMSPMDLWNQTGITSFDCGQPGQRIQETCFLLKEAFKTQSPKLVILETNAMFRDPGFLTNVSMSIIEPVRYYFPIFRYHNLWKQIIDGKKYTGRTVFKGFEIRDKVVPYEGSDHYMKETKDVQQIPEFVYYYMEDIKKMCRENGADLLLMSAPSPHNYNYKKHNAIEAYAKENALPYIDLNMKTKEIGIDWKKDSYDKGDHLNLHGAQKVTAYMGKYLKENYTLPDHRGEEGYQEWQNLAVQFQAEVEKRNVKAKK